MDSTFSNIFSTRDMYATQGVLLLSLIMGIIIIVKCADYRKNIDETNCNKDFVGRVKGGLFFMIFLALVLILIPVLYFASKFTNSMGKLKYTISMYENIVNIQYVIVGIAALLVIMSFYIRSFDCTSAGIDMIWTTPMILLLGAVGLMGLRIYSDRMEMKRASTVFGRAQRLATNIKGGIGALSSTFGSAAGYAGSAANKLGGYLGLTKPRAEPEMSFFERQSSMDQKTNSVKQEMAAFERQQAELRRNNEMENRRLLGLSSQTVSERESEARNRRLLGLSAQTMEGESDARNRQLLGLSR